MYLYCLKLNNTYLHGATWKIGLLSWCCWKIQTALLVPLKKIGRSHWKNWTAPLVPLKYAPLVPLKHALLALLKKKKKTALLALQKNSALLVPLKKSDCSTGTTEIALPTKSLVSPLWLNPQSIDACNFSKSTYWSWIIACHHRWGIGSTRDWSCMRLIIGSMALSELKD